MHVAMVRANNVEIAVVVDVVDNNVVRASFGKNLLAPRGAVIRVEQYAHFVWIFALMHFGHRAGATIGHHPSDVACPRGSRHQRAALFSDQADWEIMR